MAFFYENGERYTFEDQLMTHLDHIISRVILLARLPGNKRQREVAKELRAHLDDLAEGVRSQGYDDEAAARIVRMRFGEPQEIAAAFASVYAPERWARRILHSTILFAVSTIAVVVVVSTVQSIAAMCTAESILSTLLAIHGEILGFGAITAGYCSLYAGERLFPTSMARAALPSVTLGLCLAAVFAWLIPQHAALPLVAFACAASGRLLQRLEIPFIWFAGTALPLLIAWALFGPLIPGWQFPWLVWVGLTLSCKALREIVRLFERVFIEDFA
ncbi:MAG: permease prefix domain 1-containing protein [Candidatus Acidiferrales bacterium]